jgi:hypothetical protein
VAQGPKADNGIHKKKYMRQKTQTLLMQNYEKVKQCMLTGQSSEKAIYQIKKLGASSPRAMKGEVKYGLSCFMNTINTSTNSKKRPITEMSKEPVNNQDFIATGKNHNHLNGRFRFKFQEGHSKNFKREMPFDWFV